MTNQDDQLQELQEEIEQREADIAATSQTLQDAQNRVKRLTAQKTTLQRVLDGITANQTAIAKQRATADKELEDAEQTRTDLLSQLNNELTEEQRQGVEATIESVDDEIATLEQEVSELQQQVDEAEQAAAETKAQAAALEATFGQTQAQLRQLAGQIQATQGQVSRLKSAAKTAANDGRARKAYFLVKELEIAIARLSDLADPSKTEAQLVDDMVSQWQALRQANDEANDKAVALEQRQQELATAEKEYQSRVQGRQAEIEEKLAAGPTAPTGQPTGDKSAS